jgi:uncharacterized protein YggE
VVSVPDLADFVFAVSVRSSNAKGALAACSDRTNAMIGAIKAQGVATADIQTSQLSLSPTMNQSGTKVTGYTASNSVTVTVRKIANAGTVIDAAVAAGANEISGPTMTASNQQALYQRALRAAFANARGKAQTLASAAHLKLGTVRSMIETSSVTPFQASNGAARAVTPIEPGTIKTEADITVVFTLG